MSLWTFSPSSQELLQRCIAAAQPRDENNKWIRRFSNGKEIQDPEKQNLPCRESLEHTNPNNVEENENCDCVIINEELIDYIENEAELRVEILIEECRKNEKILTILSQRLSEPSIDQLCKYAFNTENVDVVFLESFIKFFIPAYIKKEYNRFCLDLLFQTNKIHSNLFKSLFEIIIRDNEIPSQVLCDYVSAQTDVEQMKLMEYLLDIELSKEIFANHLTTICMIYKKCAQSENIQKYVLTNLSQCGELCKNDKNYGKFFYAFLQNEKNMNENSNFKIMKEQLEIHTSPFRRPCEIILNEIQAKMQ